MTNTSGLSATAQQTVTVAAPAPAYVTTLGTSSATRNSSSGVVTVGPTGGVVAQDVQVNGGRLLLLTGLATRPLPAGATTTASLPGSSTSRMVADELRG